MGWPGEDLLIRLVELIEKSGTGLIRPWQITRTSSAETAATAHRLIAIAAAEAQIVKLKETAQTRSSATLLIEGDPVNSPTTKVEPIFDIVDFEQRITTTQKLEYLRKEVNVEKAITHAEKLLREDPSIPPEKEIDTDWFYRWRDSAGGMSSESMQQLWGHVLAGELKAPGAFSYRTMDFLRSISQDEADLIERLAAVTTEKGYVIYGRTWAKLGLPEEIKNGLPGNELSMLEELGILSGVSTMGYRDNAPPFPAPDGRYLHLLVVCQNRGLIAYTTDPTKTTKLSFYQLTKLGRSLMSLIQTPAKETFLRSLGEVLARADFKVFIADIIDTPTSRAGENEVEIFPPTAEIVGSPPDA
ncbi:DUF2806 domain-containing protein [Polaromonas sp.]|uniref:DUF2806 domain-containing protein n=1 Tax=Polaromonas sp. TaxID=1869339 RepID=UPI0027320CD9|nr:DUF2806 domain-containing protein [Polaromonas sp.]MDP1740805.1 DUF2806 domain-containing protein [Polaromonas sp.]